MNSTVKGNKLENEIFNLFSKMILENRFLWLKSECCQIRRKHGYYSKDREKNIIFDISVEITLPGQDKYSQLILIECKNYERKVEFSDVQNFHSVTQQVASSNSKSIIVSTNAFNDGAFKFAKSKGIGLLRYFYSDELQWVLARSPSSMNPLLSFDTDYLNSSSHVMCQQDIKSKYFDCHGYSYGKYTTSLNEFLYRLVNVGASENFKKHFTNVEDKLKSKTRLVPFIANKKIEAISQKILQNVSYTKGPTPLDKICKKLSEDTGLELLQNTTLAKGALGSISFDPIVIKLAEAHAEDEYRARFTLAHEIGHLILEHGKYMKKELCHESDLDIENPRLIGIQDIERMEWQANYFASYLLLPEKQLKESFYLLVKKYSLINRGHGVLYVDNQKCNKDTYYGITNRLKKEFKTSRSAFQIRLRNLGLLTDFASMNYKLSGHSFNS
ncbi:MAG: ImmA/IrrE family metallo-endopeptidase [Magnetococcales bacterium]|nr:ImmA/IrrE family metallo-endopeptidase [Magnetococcales bacterium]